MVMDAIADRGGVPGISQNRPRGEDEDPVHTIPPSLNRRQRCKTKQYGSKRPRKLTKTIPGMEQLFQYCSQYTCIHGWRHSRAHENTFVGGGAIPHERGAIAEANRVAYLYGAAVQAAAVKRGLRGERRSEICTVQNPGCDKIGMTRCGARRFPKRMIRDFWPLEATGRI